jgi:antitoxin (DNA-binding transcriptional repressor) of toxin-antitoxin stability system
MKTPVAETPSVGIREFRAALAEYIDADTPVTVTRHGQAVGLFVPLHRPNAEDVQRLQTAAAKVRKLLPLGNEDVAEVAADFDALRLGRPAPRRGGR